MHGPAKPLMVFVHGSAEMYGSDKVLLNLAVAALEDNRLQPMVVLHEAGPLLEALRNAGVETHVATVVKIQRKMFRLSALWMLWSQVRDACRELDRLRAGRPVGLVYSNTLAVMGGAVWAWHRRLRHVWHVHEIILRPAVVNHALPRLASGLSDQVIANSRETENWLLRQAPRLRSRSRVIFNGIASHAVAPQAALHRMRIRLAGGAPVLTPGTVIATLAGRLNHWKGQNLLIDALALLRQQQRLGSLRVAIVGDVFPGHDDIRASLHAQVLHLELQGSVTFVPFVEDIYEVWAASDIAVVPSLEPEPFGMVAIEAMSCALPVVAAAHGGLLDIVEDGVTGLHFKPRDVRSLADALSRLAASPLLRAELGAAGAERQRREFSLQQQVARTRALCHAVLAA